MKLSRPIQLAIVCAAALLAACAPLMKPPLGGQSQTTLKVDNQAYLDMTIYVMRGAERVRLGRASGASSSSFVIPADLLRTSTSLRFVADPIGSSRAAVSEEINVHPGDQVVIQIPPA